MTHPAVEAANVILEVMAVGSAKDGKDDSWRDKPQDYHLDRCLRHIATYKLIRNGHAELDGEIHLHNAITRLAMALVVLQA